MYYLYNLKKKEVLIIIEELVNFYYGIIWIYVNYRGYYKIKYCYRIKGSIDIWVY